MEYRHLPPITHYDKLIPKNFGKIGHLTGSKMIDSRDILLSPQEQEKYILKKRDVNDIVIITEKIDGMNAGAIKKNGLVYPINRKGYDTRLMGSGSHPELKELGESWAAWVDDQYELLDFLLEEGERLVFENAIYQHALRYRFHKSAVFLLAKFDDYNQRIDFHSLCELGEKYNLQTPPLLNYGAAIPPDIIIRQYPSGMAGSRDGIEGIVYYYEHNGKHESCAKFVSNPKLGEPKGFTGVPNQVRKENIPGLLEKSNFQFRCANPCPEKIKKELYEKIRKI